MGVPDWILVGMIKRVHGNQGEMLIKPLTDREERFSEGTQLYIARKRTDEREPVKITSSRPSDRGPLVMLEGIDSRETAQEYFGASLFVPAAQVPSAGPGNYYTFQIEGCMVYEGGRLIGTVMRLYENQKANPYIEVQPPGDEKPVFIPFVSQVISAIDVEGQRIDIVDGFLGKG